MRVRGWEVLAATTDMYPLLFLSPCHFPPDPLEPPGPPLLLMSGSPAPSFYFCLLVRGGEEKEERFRGVVAETVPF